MADREILSINVNSLSFTKTEETKIDFKCQSVDFIMIHFSLLLINKF